MIENFLAGTAALFGDPVTIGIFVFGVIGGMLFGAIPGVSMLTLAAILLPFTAGLEASQGVMLFAVIYCTGTYGGAITAILFNIPGAPENAPTAFDGYPMTRKGLAGKAVHEYRELLGWENGWLVQPAWTVESGMWSSGTFYDFMKGFFGWHNAAENIRVITYFAFLAPTLYFYLRKPVKSAA